MEDQPKPSKMGIGRRGFLKLGGGITLGTAVALALFRGPFRRAAADIQLPSPDYTPLEGACHAPLTAEEQLVAAMVDTVVPGTQTDPEGLPGALDCCAMNLIYDEFYPFVDYLPILVPLVDTTADSQYGKGFVECDLVERTEVLRAVEESLPFVRLAYRFIRSTFYAGMYSLKGTSYLRWPGPNLGYRDHEDFSFGTAVCSELTEDGNLP
jgi:hypothetical protein